MSKLTLIEQRERGITNGKVPQPPEWPKGYIQNDVLGLFNWGEEPKTFWAKLKCLMEFWKWDYTNKEQ